MYKYNNGGSRAKKAARQGRLWCFTITPLVLHNQTCVSSLRGRMEAGLAVGLGPARLAGGGNRRTARVGRRVFRRLAHRLYAVEQAANFVAGQGLVFEQAFGESLQVVPLFGDDASRF